MDFYAVTGVWISMMIRECVTDNRPNLTDQTLNREIKNKEWPNYTSGL